MVKKNDDLVSANTDGGYFAIKGFLFQFDKTLIEILKNPDVAIEIEQTQDFGVDQIYTQVKHKETQDYTPSKIQKAVKQLINEYKSNPQGRYFLYCYFKDRQPQNTTLSNEELDLILSSSSNTYTTDLKSAFLKSFTLVFAYDFESQFEILLNEIKSAFKLKTEPEAFIYHALLRGRVMDLSILKVRDKRTVNFAALESMLSQNEKVIFDLAYSKFMGNEEYLRFIKSEYFIFKNRINIPNNERLLIIGADTNVTDQELITIIQNIQNRYYSQDNSPAPYIYLHDISDLRLATIKQQLWGKGLYFSDGTHFNGDKVRPEDLTKTVHNIKGNTIKFKLVDSTSLSAAVKLIKFAEVYAFLDNESSPLSQLPNGAKTFYIEDTANMLKVL